MRRRYVIYCEATDELLSKRLYAEQQQAQGVADGINDCYVLPIELPGDDEDDE